MMIRQAIAQQWATITRDRWLLASLTWIPIALAWCIWSIFSQGIARDLPIGVVNLDKSALSYTLERGYDATSTMQVTRHFQSPSEAKAALVQGEIYAYAVIPSRFEQDAMKQLAPQVSVFYNSQAILIGKLMNAAFVQAHGTFNAQLATFAGLTDGNTTLLSAMGNAVPVSTQVTPLFNKNSNYAQFLVSAIIPALWQIVIVVSTLLVLAANQRDHGLVRWLAPSPDVALCRTLLPYFPLFWLQGAAFLVWFYSGLQWPMQGDLWVLFAAQVPTILACMAMGSVFFFLTLDPARAMSFAGAFTAPSFAFMGITFPVSDMSPLAQAWRSLLPISHYIEAQVSQVSYGASALTTLMLLTPLLGYLLPALLCLLLARKHLNSAIKAATDTKRHARAELKEHQS